MIHFANILNKSQFTDINSIPELIDFIRQLNLFHYCIICHNMLDFQATSYMPCPNKLCTSKFEGLIIDDNFVLEKFNEDPDKCEFLIKSAIDAMTCERKFDIFEPFPHYFLKYEVNSADFGIESKLKGKSYDSAKNFDLINVVISGFDMYKFTETIKKCNNDTDLINNIGKDLYILIKFILMSCKVNIIKNDNVLGIKSDNFTIYKIVHDEEKEEEFKQISNGKQTSYLFHGSRWCNWFSILRNGLKNCSKTKLMTAGAAYGDGIYLSDDANLSFGYGLSGNKSIIGVFELLDKQKWSKGNTIYVVNDEKVLVQRYLLIIPKNNNSECIKEINTIFNKTIHVEKSNASLRYNKKCIEKIIREYRQLNKLPDKPFRLAVDPDNIFEWSIYYGTFDNKYLIAQDMKKFNIKEIQIEIKFPPNYPFSPPFVRVVLPRFKHLTGHVLSSGAFCNELLTEKGWSPVCTIEMLIIQLMSEIIEGNGRVDEHMFNIPYSFDEAKAGFLRVAKQHGWM